jgi:protocatechuate 3,4-dioxygenase beta subunit
MRMEPSQRGQLPRTYQGRSLPKPYDEVVDQGLGFDLATLVDRRLVLRTLGVGLATLGLTSCDTSSRGSTASRASASSSASSRIGTAHEIPAETAGPFPGDGSNGPDVLEQAGVVRSDIRSSFGGARGTAEGVLVTLDFTIADLAQNGTAFAGAAAYVWHCDRDGRYSLYSDGATDQNYLRGVQIADGAGRVRFTSIFPACYQGRWPHVHFEVYADKADITAASKAIATSQVALPETACREVYAQQGYEQSAANLSTVSLQSDMVFRDDSAVRQLATATGSPAGGYSVSLTVAVDTRTPPGRT